MSNRYGARVKPVNWKNGSEVMACSFSIFHKKDGFSRFCMRNFDKLQAITSDPIFEFRNVRFYDFSGNTLLRLWNYISFDVFFIFKLFKI